jgi:type II secretion system protein L
MQKRKAIPAPSETLVLFGGLTPEAPIAWARVVRGEVIAQGIARLGEPAPLHTARTALVLPGMEGRVQRVALPARSLAQASAAASYAFAGEVADAAPLHCAAGEAQGAQGHRLVAVIARQRLQDWLDRCSAMGADPGFVAFDFTLWPTDADGVAIVDGGAHVLVAGGGAGGFTAEAELACALVPGWLAKLGLRDASVFGGEERDWPQILHGAARVRLGLADDPALVLARQAATPPAAAPNLRQGQFALTASRAPADARSWKLAAGLAALALLMQPVALVAAGYRDARAAEAIRTAAEADLRAARPDLAGLEAVAAQVSELNQGAPHQSPLLAASSMLSEILLTTPSARLEEIRQEGEQGAIIARLSALDEADLQAIGADLSRRGFAVEARATAQQQGRHRIEYALGGQS